MSIIPSTASNSLWRASARDQATLGAVWDDPIALNVAVADGVMGSTDTEVTEQTYVLTDFTGDLVGAAGELLDVASGTNVPRSLSITTTAQSAAYNVTDPILVTGTWWWTGVAVTLSVYLTETNGNETVYSPDLLLDLTNIVVPAQLLDTGSFTVGCGTAVAMLGNLSPHRKNGGGSRGIYVGTTGVLSVKLMEKAFADAPVPYTNFPAGIESLWIRSIHEATTATGLVRVL